MSFLAGPPGLSTIGVVYGRRRQGKSYMLDHLAGAVGGFRFQALEETREAALATFYRAVSQYGGLPAAVGTRFEDWGSAFRALAELARDRLIVLDEFPYLLRDSGELPSVIQAAFDDSKMGRHPSFRLILCGSALSVMGKLLTGTKALRGRARLDLAIESFDFRTAKSYWGIEDPEVAFIVDAIFGGAPGYRDLVDAPPARVAGLERWLSGNVLNPSHALFREADYLLTEDTSMTDRALYRSIFSAIAGGEATKGGVAKSLGRKEAVLDFPLTQLEKAAFIVRDHDMLRPNRPLLRVVDPMLRFYFAIVRRDLARFEARETTAAWQDAKPRLDSQVAGPHFEAMARLWARKYASNQTLGGPSRQVGFVQVNDPELRQAFELDVVIRATDGDGPKLQAIGEAKGGEAKRAQSDLQRLERLRGLLTSRADAASAKLLLFGRSGFDADLEEAARGREDVELIDLRRLYEGE